MADALTALRILCGLAVLFCPAFSKGYYLLYLFGSLTDALDGAVARRLGKETEFGARLDTIADTVFVLAVMIKTICAVYVPVWLIVWIAVIAAVKALNVISGLVRYRRFVPVHSAANKVCGALLFVLPLCIGRFPWQPVAVLVILTCVAATFAAVQEGHLIRTGKTK